MIEAAEELGQTIGLQAACQQLNVPRSAVYRARQQSQEAPRPRPKPSRALSDPEREKVRAVLNSERFCDCSPYQVYATLLDEDQLYLCSISTMYRILHEYDEVRERRDQRRHPPAAKPQLVATGPNQLWSWDITQLPGPRKGQQSYLYVILDVYSRYVVGWLIANRASARLAEELIRQSCAKAGIEPEQLSLHADRGAPMRSQTVAELLGELGVTKSHTRPYTPNDNPYSEAQFKTMKYRPDFPGRFGSLAEARAWAQAFFHWYNHQHRHSALGLLTPATVQQGLAQQVRAQRQEVLKQAYQAHPERFVGGEPTPPDLPAEVWINPPEPVEAKAEPSQSARQPRRAEVTTPVAAATGAQTGSRGAAGPAERALEPGEHRASLVQGVVTLSPQVAIGA